MDSNIHFYNLTTKPYTIYSLFLLGFGFFVINHYISYNRSYKHVLTNILVVYIKIFFKLH